jgi:hypothetical protein
MSCVHCNASEQPAGRARSRFCVGCGRRLLPVALPSRRARPLQRAVEEPAAAAG